MSSKRVSYATWQSYTPAQKAAKKKAIQASTKGRGVPRIRGKGAYTYDKPGPWGRIGRVAGGMIGSALGTPYGLGKAGGAIGQKVGSMAHYIGRIFGSGDYIQGAPVKNNSILQPQAPSFKSGAAQVNIKHREFLGDVISSSTANTFNITSFSLNPGLQSTLPWLSQVCGSTFQQYRINGMVFEFRSMSADALNSTNTALGSVVMCTDYDSADVPFSSKQQMENTEFGVSCKPSSNMIHAIECAPKVTTATELYIRARNIPAGTDIRLYDWGKFYIATSGFQGTNVNCGELWVSYDITLIKAIEQPPGYLNNFIDYNLAGTNPSTPLLLDTSVRTTQPAYDSVGTTIAGNLIVFPLTIEAKSVWELTYFVRGASAALTAPTLLFLGGLQSSVAGLGLSAVYINGTSTGFNTTGMTGTNLVLQQTFSYDGTGTTGAPPSILFGTGGSFPVAPVQGGNLIIRQLPSVSLPKTL